MKVTYRIVRCENDHLAKVAGALGLDPQPSDVASLARLPFCCPNSTGDALERLYPHLCPWL